MAVEIDKLGSRRYTLPNSDIVHVVPTEGQPYTITPLETDIHGRRFDSWIYEPEDPVTSDATVLNYGLGESGAINEAEAHYIATLGMPIALHDTPRRQEMPPLRSILTNPRLQKRLVQHALNPLILPSQATERVVDAVQAHSSRYKKFNAKSRSMGGVSGAMNAAHDTRIDTLYLDGAAGIVSGNALLNHATGFISIATAEIPPAAMAFMQYGPKDALERVTRHMNDDPTRIFREIGFLTLKRPDISKCLEELAERDVTVIAVGHELDGFFEDSNMDSAIKKLVARGLIHVHKRSLGTRHVHGIEKPKESAQLYHDLIMQAKQQSTVPLVAAN